MGKLVLFLADGTLIDVPLDKERTTLGRRADNDVCLPYPAVSGEHAAVVTILADSFLEDLGSTNGTLVNGKAVLKHFLRDHDQIDIGRQRLVYMSDNDAKVEPLPPDQLRHLMLGLTERVAEAKPMADAASSASGGRRRNEFNPDAPLLADLDRLVEGAAPVEPLLVPPRGARTLETVAAMTSGLAPRFGEKLSAPPQPAPSLAGSPSPSPSRSPTSSPTPTPSPSQSSTKSPVLVSVSSADPLPVRMAARAARVDTQSSPSANPPAATAVPGAAVRVLSGPSAGRTVPLLNDQLTLGRVGVQVAAVRRDADGYRLVPLEGADVPSVNGAPVAPEGAPLRLGDTFEVAGIRLELAESVQATGSVAAG